MLLLWDSQTTKKPVNLLGEAPDLGFFLESCAAATAMHSDLSP